MSESLPSNLRTPEANILRVLGEPHDVRKRHARVEAAVSTIVVVVATLHALTFFNQACDDGFISLGYAERWVQGRGLTLNDVEPSEGYSNLLWVVLMAGAMTIGLDAVLTIKLVGLACGVGVAVGAARLARGCGGGPWRQLGAGLFAALATPLAVWSVLLLETPLYALELVLLALLARRLARRGGRIAFALTGGATVLTRPEGFLVAGGLCVALLLVGQRSRRVRRGLLIGLLVVGAVVIAHQVFRVSYFGTWVGNSGVHKWHPAGVTMFLERGLDHLGDLTQFMWRTESLWVWAVLLWPLVPRRTRRRLRPVALVTAAATSFHLLVGGDNGPYFRFLVPAIAPAGVLLSFVGEVGRARSQLARLPRAIGPTLAVFVGVSGMAAMLVWRPLPSHFYAHPSILRPTAHAEVAAWLNEHAEPDDRVLLSEMGLIPYASDLACFDYLGLCDRFMYGRGLHGLEFHPERFDRHHPDFVIIGFKVMPDGRVATRTKAGTLILSRPAFGQTFEPAAEFLLQRDRSMMERGYYGDDPPGTQIWFRVFRRKVDAATQSGSGAAPTHEG